MSIETIETDFKQKVSEQIRLTSECVNRYRVLTPFMLEDGDHLAIVLRHEADHWVLSDEGHYLHASDLRD